MDISCFTWNHYLGWSAFYLAHLFIFCTTLYCVVRRFTK